MEEMSRKGTRSLTRWRVCRYANNIGPIYKSLKSGASFHFYIYCARPLKYAHLTKERCTLTRWTDFVKLFSHSNEICFWCLCFFSNFPQRVSQKKLETRDRFNSNGWVPTKEFVREPNTFQLRQFPQVCDFRISHKKIKTSKPFSHF